MPRRSMGHGPNFQRSKSLERRILADSRVHNHRIAESRWKSPIFRIDTHLLQAPMV